MLSLIDAKGRVNHGCFDGPIRFNPEAFRLRTFFGRELKGVRKRLAWGAFNYVGILGPDFVAGVAAVRLGYAAQVFGFLYDHTTGSLFERTIRTLPSRLVFTLDPDESRIAFSGSGCSLCLEKSHAQSFLSVDAEFGNRLRIQGRFLYGFERQPLRVVNPSCGDPRRFTFTEKCSPLRPESLELSLDGVPRSLDLARTVAIYDWSAGYFNRHTNWLWAAFGGVLPDGTEVGANFAALVNESFYPENAFWIAGKRVRLPQVIFQFDAEDPYREDWRIFTEDGRVELRFHPLSERAERSHLPFVKVNFRQFMGEYSGTLVDGQGCKVELAGLMGLAEIHLSVW